MNTTNKPISNSQPVQPGSFGRLRAACAYCYQEALRRLTAVKARVEREFGQEMAGYEPLLKAAINEAEAVAWQTPYPHLFFPVLAEEKAAEAQQWAGHQRAIQERTSLELEQLPLAA
jgi:hypothetical protein